MRASTTGSGRRSTGYWLDVPAMMYTCAYWKEGTTTLEEAQRNKMDHVCRKVQLKPGETFVDVGSGWGGLLFHAWEHYGALGTGVNATTEQVAEIARRNRAPRARATRSGSSNAISARCPASTTSCCRSARSSTPAATRCPRSCARTPRR